MEQYAYLVAYQYAAIYMLCILSLSALGTILEEIWRYDPLEPQKSLNRRWGLMVNLICYALAGFVVVIQLGYTEARLRTYKLDNWSSIQERETP